MKLNSKIVALTFTILAPALSHAQTILVSDNFTLNGDDRVAGGSIAGTSPEFGSGTYGVPGGFSADFAASGGIGAPVNVAQASDFFIGITAPSTAYSVSGTFNFNGGSADGSNSNFVTLLNGNVAFPYGAFSADLRDDGYLALVVNGATLTDSLALYQNLNVNGTYTLTLNFDPTTDKASILVNGTTIIAPINVGVDPSTIVAAGYFGTNPPANPSEVLTHFDVTAAAVPEPSSVALMLTGVVALGFIARRKLQA